MNAILLIDLTFGDAGKGSLVDFLASQHTAHTIIRFNGGAQAAHNVIAPDGRHHTFSQFGSATFLPRTCTHLSRFVLFDPVALLGEETHLRTLGVHDAWQRISVDERAPVVSPFQKAANRLREIARGDGRHGSCGMGIGETMADLLAPDSQDLILHVADLLCPARLRAKLRALQALKQRQCADMQAPGNPHAERESALLEDPAAPEEFARLFELVARKIRILPDADDLLHTPGTVLFEGAQGVLLDEWYGFHPHTTWSTTTFENATTLLREHCYRGAVRRIGALRGYLTRHGPGPFVSETPAATFAEHHNTTNPWQSAFRVGWQDLVMLRYALDVAQTVDELAITCLDQLAHLQKIPLCATYTGMRPPHFLDQRLQRAAAPDLAWQEQLTRALEACQPLLEQIPQRDYLPFLESATGLPISLTSHGPTRNDKRTLPKRANRGPARSVPVLPPRPPARVRCTSNASGQPRHRFAIIPPSHSFAPPR
jgi:adenylosuccinate synthase